MGVLKAVIFTEAGKNYGLGHLSRCIAFKNYLEDADFVVEIYNRGDYESPNAKSVNWLEISRSHLENILENVHLVVVDSYYADYEFYAFLLRSAKICVALDDFSRIKYPKDALILNPALNAKRLYMRECENEIYAGIEYGLLRAEFTTREPKKINKDISKVLITLGGNDFQNNTQKVLDAVQKELSYAQINVVLPRYYEPLNYGFETQIYSNLSARELKDLMLESDLVISGGGVTAVEVQSTRTPSIALEIAPNQSYQLRQWQKVGLRIAQNHYALKSLIKSLVKLKDRNKVYNALNKISIGAELPRFAKMLKERVE